MTETPSPPTPHGDYLVYVDESGDHGLNSVDSQYPIFVLAFCLFKKADYITLAVPALQRLKHKYWGHDEIVLHEHEIRKPNRHYSFLFNQTIRAEFMTDLSTLVETVPFKLVCSVIKKLEYNKQYSRPANPYELALEFGLERIFRELEQHGQSKHTTTVVLERRGKREDQELELAFRRICDGANALSVRFPFQPVMIPKAANSAGLQIADLVARPVGMRIFRPAHQNRAFDVLEKKLRRSPEGKVSGWGLKVFP